MSKICKERNTNETQISLKLELRAQGKYAIKTPYKFFTHMLEQISSHSSIDIQLDSKALDDDAHHLVEDCAITLGMAIKEALGDKKGIKRYSSVILPMDEALVLCAIDISGRGHFECDVEIKEEKTSDFETVLLAHFFNSFANNAGITIHLRKMSGKDPHHIIECCFKAFARALKDAISINPDSNTVPSTKGVL